MNLKSKPIVGLLLAVLAIIIQPAHAVEHSDVMPYESHSIKIMGSNMHYVEGGAPGGEVFLFLHGNPTSSYYGEISCLI